MRAAAVMAGKVPRPKKSMNPADPQMLLRESAPAMPIYTRPHGRNPFTKPTIQAGTSEDFLR